ncbi:MAG: D-alanyl-D-alanine carboxypeptidase family protein [Synechococcales cyanobacterium RU_4_20]|nr:D-alanyl-D-alanine carboxypeptidase family protein [Synechococcales cyanobacterium RU_4_20]
MPPGGAVQRLLLPYSKTEARPIRYASAEGAIANPPAATQPSPSQPGFIPSGKTLSGKISDVKVSNQGPAAEEASSKAILGHFPYPEAPLDTLVEVAPGIKLSKAAAEAYQNLEKAARADGVNLVLLSGFRSVEDQKYLFFGVKGERGQTASERAKVSAPPGYSEHHTGYAMDIGDAAAPGSNLSDNFEQSQAFKWLEKNAAYSSFELSFPKGNSQGVNYEPWHWRFVGDQQSLETFHQNPAQPSLDPNRRDPFSPRVRASP